MYVLILLHVERVSFPNKKDLTIVIA
jgi:hypothetical protein